MLRAISALPDRCVVWTEDKGCPLAQPLRAQPLGEHRGEGPGPDGGAGVLPRAPLLVSSMSQEVALAWWGNPCERRQ